MSTIEMALPEASTSKAAASEAATLRPQQGRFLANLGARAMAVFEALAKNSRGMRCAEEADRLFKLSDEDLARKGLTRDRIITHAFGIHV